MTVVGPGERKDPAIHAARRPDAASATGPVDAVTDGRQIHP